ncbi:uncharacterized protein C5L36_0B01550 [Pichia kudriavzevii]|uniref:Pre-mRNA-splicing factor CWC25 n=1 Tax=Pichia kudriavzevii TaxID=4909 RepID=A0A2U9R0Q3_PICKU|nr:uncharacterized protein C5L36_0B01550 [Pichia kudriavzevii]AWU74890.1 hypothetical protein C5L36_0B01550 [Pichia kudriavzevii]
MPSDLNLKKSWNPKLLKNREIVWQREQELLREHRKNQLHKAKLDEINEKNELLSLTEPSKDLTKRKDKNISWMYGSEQSASTDGEKIDEDILLGKRSVVDALVDNAKKDKKLTRMEKVMKTGEGYINQDNQSGEMSTKKKIAKLSKDDPLYTMKLQQIKRQEYLARQEKANSLRARIETNKKTSRNSEGRFEKDHGMHNRCKNKEHSAKGGKHNNYRSVERDSREYDPRYKKNNSRYGYRDNYRVRD